MAQLMSERSASANRPSSPGGGTSESNTAVETGLDEDAIFDVLGASRRRLVLQSLHEHGGETSVGELAERIAAAENDLDDGTVSPAQRKRAYVALYQNHLPKLAKYGAIEYDREVGLVRLRESSRPLLAYIHFDPDESSLLGSRCTIRGLLRCVRSFVRR